MAAFLLVAVQLHALDVKDFTFSHLGKAEGVDNQRVFSVCQTSSGAIWWATMTGVVRYNGSKVRNYRLDEGVAFAHLGGRVIRMVTDTAMIYAFDNRGSVFAFNALYDKFDFITSISEKLGHEVALNDMYAVGDKLFLALHDGVYMMKEEKLVQVIKGAYVNKIVPVRNRLVFCARDGVYNEKGQRLLPYNTECGYYDELSGRLWLGGYENGLHVVTLSEDGGIVADEFVALSGNPLQQNPIRSLCPYDDETMLVGIDGAGVFQMGRDGITAHSCRLLFDANESEYGVLHGNGVYCIIVDSWKNIVIGTYSGGIDIARPIGSTTAVYRHVAHDRNSLLNDNVNMVMPLSPELLLMGTDNGISIRNLTTGEWQHCCQGTVELSASRKPDGHVLVSTYGKGVFEIDGHANVQQVYTKKNSPLKDDHVYATLYDREGGLWVGTLDGDLMYTPPHLSPQYYPVHAVQVMTQLASGQIAVGTAFGLKLITPSSDKIEDLNYAPPGVNDVNPFVTHLLAVGMELWIATDGGGVYVYHLGKHESRQMTTANGLPSNYVRSLVKGRDGRIWVATDEGLAFVTSDNTRQVVNVNYCYGLNREYSFGAAQNMPDGDIIFGSTTGAVIIHPENVQPVNYTARLFILQVSSAIDEDNLHTEAFFKSLRDGQLRLLYRQRTFDLWFESVNMRNHFDIAYRYKIDEGEWSQPTDQQYIHFVSMEPGRHQLTLQCISRTSGTVIDTLELTITIAQPWWNSWWMWCVYACLILLAFYGVWRVYELQEKYMRLSIDYLQIREAQPQTESPKEIKDAPIKSQIQTLEPEDVPSCNEKSDGEMVKLFVDKATKLIVENMSNSAFTIDCLCREMAMSRTLFYVKLKTYTGKSPQDFIRVIRLERAAALLRNGRSVTDAAALTGFDNPKYFSTVFKKYFGVSPSKYQ